jgi:hypothetical protein
MERKQMLKKKKQLIPSWASTEQPINKQKSRLKQLTSF